jgi:hypothetical protein
MKRSRTTPWNRRTASEEDVIESIPRGQVALEGLRRGSAAAHRGDAAAEGSGVTVVLRTPRASAVRVRNAERVRGDAAPGHPLVMPHLFAVSLSLAFGTVREPRHSTRSG